MSQAGNGGVMMGQLGPENMRMAASAVQSRNRTPSGGSREDLGYFGQIHGVGRRRSVMGMTGVKKSGSQASMEGSQEGWTINTLRLMQSSSDLDFLEGNFKQKWLWIWLCFYDQFLVPQALFLGINRTMVELKRMQNTPVRLYSITCFVEDTLQAINRQEK
jgi:hypothetical protein